MDSSSRFALRTVVGAVLGGIVCYLSYSLLAVVLDNVTVITVAAALVGVAAAFFLSPAVLDRLEPKAP